LFSGVIWRLAVNRSGAISLIDCFGMAGTAPIIQGFNDCGDIGDVGYMLFLCIGEGLCGAAE